MIIIICVYTQQIVVPVWTDLEGIVPEPVIESALGDKCADVAEQREEFGLFLKYFTAKD